MQWTNRSSFRVAIAATVISCNGAIGCGATGEDGSGSLIVLLESEGTITDGLEPGEEVENVRDGWAVDYEEFIVTVGAIEVHLAEDEQVAAEASETFVVDLTQVSAAGLALWSLDGLREGRWDFNFVTPVAVDGTKRHDSVSQDDFDAMLADGWTYLIGGVLTKDDGQSCPPAALVTPGERTPNGDSAGGNDCYDAPLVRFTLGAAAPTRFGPCEIDAVPGFAIADGATPTVAITIHGDHLFFNGFPGGAEGGITRLAQWLADSDLDLDGSVTHQELQAIAPAQLQELDERYQLGGSPITPLDDMLDYVIGQLKTQGHFQGEGECPIDGLGE